MYPITLSEALYIEASNDRLSNDWGRERVERRPLQGSPLHSIPTSLWGIAKTSEDIGGGGMPSDKVI